MEILRGEGHQQNALLQLVERPSLHCSEVISLWSEIVERTERECLERTSGILLEQKLGQSFDNFIRRAALVGRAEKYLFIWLENIHH